MVSQNNLIVLHGNKNTNKIVTHKTNKKDVRLFDCLFELCVCEFIYVHQTKVYKKFMILVVDLLMLIVVHI